MRRQTAGTGTVLKRESCTMRLDPFELPARVVYRDATRAGDAPRIAIIGSEKIMIRRETGAGVPLYLTVPLRAYAGVLLSVRDTPDTCRVSLQLHHPNRDLGVPLFEADDTDDVIADWRAWSRTLRRPLLIEENDGGICEPFERIGAVTVKRPKARRVNTFFAERRPKFLCRRKVGGAFPGAVFHEDEIIARAVND
jgi:Family of unknown function (DUF6101)